MTNSNNNNGNSGNNGNSEIGPDILRPLQTKIITITLHPKETLLQKIIRPTAFFLSIASLLTFGMNEYIYAKDMKDNYLEIHENFIEAKEEEKQNEIDMKSAKNKLAEENIVAEEKSETEKSEEKNISPTFIKKESLEKKDEREHTEIFLIQKNIKAKISEDIKNVEPNIESNIEPNVKIITESEAEIIAEPITITEAATMQETPEEKISESIKNIETVEVPESSETLESSEISESIEVPESPEISESTDPIENPSFTEISKDSEYPEAEFIWNYFKSKGYNDYVVSGILGNIMVEVGGQTLAVRYWEKSKHYFGMCQWCLDWYYGPKDANLEQQCDYLYETIKKEIDTFGYAYKKGFNYEKFLAMENCRDAALAFSKCYERNTAASYSIRQSSAERAYNYFTGK